MKYSGGTISNWPLQTEEIHLFYRAEKILIAEFSSLFPETLPRFPPPGGVIGCKTPAAGS